MLLSLLSLALLLAAAAPATASPVRAQVEAWISRLEQEIVTWQQQPQTPITGIGAGPMLKLNASGERVRRLAQRLRELGYLAAEHQSEVFGTSIEAAVRAFQESQQLKPDGRVGDRTRFALELTPAIAIESLRQTVEALRSFAAQAPDRGVLVNLPSQTATLIRQGQVVFTMRVVVGRPSRETPLLHDSITHIIVNPTWTVPPTVLRNDKLPLLRKTGSPGIDAADVYLDGEWVLPETVDWNTVSPGRVRIVQSPGDHNALGRFRFNLTNDQNIYLHGTNDPKVFSRDTRAVSSGCVRLEDARRMAEELLMDNGLTAIRLDPLLITGRPQWIKLNRPMPVRFVYWLATLEEDGSVRIHPDIYNVADETGAPI